MTVSNDEHFVMEATPFRALNYDVVAAGLYTGAGTQALSWITVNGRTMQWVLVLPIDEGSLMAGHLMLVWATKAHTYALGFHILPPGGEPMAKALDIAVAQHLVMIQPNGRIAGVR